MVGKLGFSTLSVIPEEVPELSRRSQLSQRNGPFFFHRSILHNHANRL